MRPDDTNVPSDPPPQELPRARYGRMSDVRPTQPAPVRPVQPHEQHLLAQPHQAERLAAVGTPDSEHALPPPVAPGQPQLSEVPVSDISLADPTPPKKSRSKLKLLLGGIAALVLLVLVAAAAAIGWYQVQLQPVDSANKQHVRVAIEPGSTPSMIGQELEQSGVIRSKIAFMIYTDMKGIQNTLKAGTYNLKPSESLEQIVGHLVSGKQDEFSITFLPGDTLAKHKERIIEAGYTEAEVNAALKKTYDRPLFAGKPAGADLEGYIYGETYQIFSSASVEDILNRTFDEYEKAITENNLVEGFKKQGHTLYQGITLASIVQREVPTAADQKRVAGVFYNRLEAGMTLGSDVTYQYAADKTGVERTPDLDSPYNTRKFPGLPPGPIASPGLSALKAVADPESNDYLFFLSGDDDKTYFGRTDAEHQQNIVAHCQKKCQIL